MMKTKPSVRLLATVGLLAALILVSCSEERDPNIDDAVRGMRPMGQVLALRMKRVKSTVVESNRLTLPVPDSHTKWRVESLLWDRLGENARRLQVDVSDQYAQIHGSIPTHWQAKEIRDELAQLEVLRGADIRWHVERPNERKPLPRAPATDEEIEQEGAE